MKGTYFKKLSILLILAIAITLALTVTVLATEAVGATEGLTESSGMDFLNNNESLHVSKDIEEMPRTYEAVIYVPAGTSSEGTIFGNYLNLQMSHINFSINSAGQPKIYIHDSDIKNERQTTLSFGKDIRGSWAHVVITHETVSTGDVFKCYVNGALVGEQTSAFSYSDVDMKKMQSATSLHIGRDFRAESKGYFFKGRINDFALYNRALTADEIIANFNSGIQKNEQSLILYYDFDGTDGKNRVADASGNGHDAKSIFFERESEPSGYAYSFAILGDTQFLVNYDTVNNTSYAKDIFDWILANKDKYSINRVLGVGDITETPKIDTDGDGVKDTIDEAQEQKEWIYAGQLYDMLTEDGLPYSITWGLGHDRPAKFDEYFADKSNFTSSDIGYYSGTSLRNYYQRFTVGQTNYMVMALELSPDAPVLEWADEVIKANPNDRVIILTHYYLETDATLSSDTQPIFDTLVDNNPNVFMTLSGHVNYASNIVRRRTVCSAGHTVTELLINPQYMDREYGYTETGMVAMLYFSEDGNDVQVEYISTTKTKNSTTDVLYSGKNQFSFSSIEYSDTSVTKYGTIPDEYSNASKYPFVIFDSNKTFVGASAYLYESTSSKTSAIYLAKEHLKTNFFDGERYTGDVLSVVILMRCDVSMTSSESFNNLSQIQGTLTIDLDGHTLCAPNADDKYLFPSEMKAWTGAGTGDKSVFPTEIRVINGKINTYQKPLIQWKPNANAPGKQFSYVFEGVSFFVLGNTTEFAINHASKDTVALYPTVTFNDCNIDITGATASSITLFSLGNSNTNASVYLNGGSIIAGGKSFSMTSKDSGKGELVFGNGESGAYTVLNTSLVACVPTEKYNGNSLWFEKTDEAGVYKLVIQTKYGTIPAQNSDPKEYPFVIFDSNKTFVGASAYLYESSSSKTSAIYLAKEHLKTNFFDGESYTGDVLSAVILMRRDVSMTSSESFNNLSQIQGTLTIDLDGHTLCAPNANDKYLFLSEMKAWTGAGTGDKSVFPTEIKVINGKINTYQKPLIQWKPNANAPGKQFSYVFEDVSFFVLGNTTEFAMNHTNKDTIALYPTVTFNDCNIDITGATASNITLFSLGNSNTNASVYMNGGSIIAGGKSFSMTSKASGEGELVFGKSEGIYTTLKIDSQMGAPSDEFGGLVFVKSTAEAGSDSYILIPKAIADFKPQTSITLDSNLILNIYIPENSYLTEITLDGKTYAIGDLTATDGKYRLTVELPAAEAARDVALTVTFGEEGSASYTLSVLKYAEKLLADTDSTATTKTLVCNMLAYVKSAYAYFAETDAEKATATEVANAIDALIGTGYTAFKKVDGATTNMAVGEGVTFILDSTPRIRFYFAEGTDLTKYAFKIGGVAQEFTATSETIGETNFVCADISLFAYKMIGTIEVFKDGASQGTFHINAYYDFAKTQSNNALVEVVERFYEYCKSAKAYRDEVIGDHRSQ